MIVWPTNWRSWTPPAVPRGTYFLTTDVRPLGYADGVDFCRDLPTRCGVVAIPHQVFYDNVEAGRPYALGLLQAGSGPRGGNPPTPSAVGSGEDCLKCEPMELTCDVPVGAGCGGIAAALAATNVGHLVIMTEAGDRVGGQLTSQAVPPDEHPWVEATGTTASYRQLRDAVRARYRQTRRLTAAAAQ